MDIKNVSMQVDFPGADQPGPGVISLRLEVLGRPELVAAIAEMFRVEPGGMAWLGLLYEALQVGQRRSGPSIFQIPVSVSKITSAVQLVYDERPYEGDADSGSGSTVELR